MFPSLSLRVEMCAQCWTRIACTCSKISHRPWYNSHLRGLKKYSPNATLNGVYHTRNISYSRCLWQEQTSSPTKNDEISLEKNPYFVKYKEQLQHLKSNSPELYEEKLEQLKKMLTPKPVKETDSKKTDATATDIKTKKNQAANVMSKSLDSIMKIELVKDKSAQELEQLWREYHTKKDCIYAVIKEEDYVNLMMKSKIGPLFIYPLPRDDGYEFLLSQIDGNEIHFTPLAMYKRLKENAPSCLTLTHYTEFQKEKGIVLMNGEYDSSVLSLQEALSLVNQMTLYYRPTSALFNLVRLFNHSPDKFNYQDLIDNLQNIHKLMES